MTGVFRKYVLGHIACHGVVVVPLSSGATKVSFASFFCLVESLFTYQAASPQKLGAGSFAVFVGKTKNPGFFSGSSLVQVGTTLRFRK